MNRSAKDEEWSSLHDGGEGVRSARPPCPRGVAPWAGRPRARGPDPGETWAWKRRAATRGVLGSDTRGRPGRSTGAGGYGRLSGTGVGRHVTRKGRMSHPAHARERPNTGNSRAQGITQKCLHTYGRCLPSLDIFFPKPSAVRLRGNPGAVLERRPRGNSPPAR
jgi:hypothetical protein